MSHDRFDVAIAGYGPVGAVVAHLCGLAGLRTVVIEPSRSVYHLPRAAHFDAEIMRTFQHLGIVDEVLPACAAMPGMDVVNADGRVLRSFDTRGRRGEHGWEASWMFYQPELEAALRRGVDRCPQVEVQLGCELESFEQDDAGVELTVVDEATGASSGIVASYLLGCDGARSVVRRSGGFGVDDLGFDQPWVVVDTILRRPVELSPVTLQICDPARPATFVPMSGDRRRWEFMLLPGEDPSTMDAPEQVHALLSRWVDPEDVEIVRAVVYTFHALIAQPWRDRRVFLVGDAAHQMPPFFGQGMCSGVRDARNLVWKLDLVLRGLAPDALLDSYEQERSPHVRSIVEAAVALGGILQTTDVNEAASRDEVMLADTGTAHGRPPDDGAGLLPPLLAGVLQPDHGGGRHFLQPPLRDGTWLDDRLGPGFALVGRPTSSEPVLAAELVDWWAAIGGRVVHVDASDDGGALDGWLADGRWALLRPDRYAFGVGVDPLALVDDLRTSLAGSLVTP